MNLNENITRIKQVMGLITESEGSYDAVLVGGLDYRSSDFPIEQQVDMVKKGFGSDKKQGFLLLSTVDNWGTMVFPRLYSLQLSS